MVVPVLVSASQTLSTSLKKHPDGEIHRGFKLTQEVTVGPYAGRKVFNNLNVQNPNADAERIGNFNGNGNTGNFNGNRNRQFQRK